MLKLVFSAILGCSKAIEIAGVAPADQHLYQPDVDNTFACLSDPTIRIPFSHVNDDYCDCPDGSDEPGTAACSNGKFWCKGSEEYIPSRLVSDGVCDYEACCDGSDEAPGLCEDRCAEVKAEQEKRKQAHLKFLEEGAKLRDEMVAQAEVRRFELSQLIDNAKAEIQVTKSELQFLEEELVRAEEEESQTDADAESMQAIVDIRSALQEADKHLEELYAKLFQLKDAYAELDGALSQMAVDYNPNFNDPAVKDAIKKWKAHAKPNLSTPPSPNLLEEVSRLEKIKIASSLEVPVQEGGLGWRATLLNFLPPVISKNLISRNANGNGKTGPRVQIVQEKIKEVSTKLDGLERELKLNTKLLTLGTDFWGPDEIGRSAENLCVSIKRGDFTYEACLFGTAAQVDGYNHVQLGRSTGLLEANKIEFVGGNKCPNGVDRSVTLHLSCGHTTEAYSVEEPEVCHYVMKATSPIVCYRDDKSSTIIHDEL